MYVALVFTYTETDVKNMTKNKKKNNSTVDCMPSRDYKWRSNRRKQREQQKQWQNRNTCANELLQFYSNSPIYFSCCTSEAKQMLKSATTNIIFKTQQKLHRTRSLNSEGKTRRKNSPQKKRKITSQIETKKHERKRQIYGWMNIKSKKTHTYKQAHGTTTTVKTTTMTC